MPVQAPRHRPARPAAKRHEARGGSAERGYGWRWRRARTRFLRDHPLCAHCLDDGRTETATEVDHKVPHCGDDALMWDESNWQSLCKRCHSRKTAREDGGFGRGQ